MSIAWSTVAVVLLLLPGLAALFGFYSCSKLSRDVVARGTLLQLGVIIFIAFVIHFVFVLAINSSAMSFGWPAKIDLKYVFAFMDTGAGRSVSVEEMTDAIDRSLRMIGIYFLVTMLSAFCLGRWVGMKVIDGSISFIATHSWAFQLVGADQNKNGYTLAYVLTNISNQGRVLMYRGMLAEFNIAADGKISYIVLRDGVRFYLALRRSAPETTEAKSFGKQPLSDTGFRFLMIEGEDIANVVYHRINIDSDTD